MEGSKNACPPVFISDLNWENVFMLHHPTHSRSPQTFKAVIGCCFEVVGHLWEKYLFRENQFEPLDLLLTLSFLFLYIKNDIAMASLWGVCKDTFFKTVWETIFYLEQRIDEVSNSFNILFL